MMPRCIFLVLLFISPFIRAQDTAGNRQWLLSGYVRDVHAFSYLKNRSGWQQANELQGRADLRWQPSGKITAALGVRNIIITNNTPGNPVFAGEPAARFELFNASVLWDRSKDVTAFSQPDRLWVEYKGRNWRARAGRQRLEWGMATTWNPNDLFNPYNFLDINYEERPASDAVDLLYNFNDSSGIELAFSSPARDRKLTAAGRFFLKDAGYRLQFTGGLYDGNPTIGFGWSGHIGPLEYRGEGQAFVTSDDNDNGFNYTIELGHRSRDNWHISSALLHNGNGVSAPLPFTFKQYADVTPLSLMPARWNFNLSAAKKFGRDAEGKVLLAYSPGARLLVVLPSLHYHFCRGLDADLLVQSFSAAIANGTEEYSCTAFLRMKWSF